MTLQQEAVQMINIMPEDNIRILVELMQKMVSPSDNINKKGNLSKYYGSMHIAKDGLALQREMRDDWE